MKVRIVLLQVDKIKFEGSEENNLVSPRELFSPRVDWSLSVEEKKGRKEVRNYCYERQTGTLYPRHIAEETSVALPKSCLSSPATETVVIIQKMLPEVFKGR